MKSKCFQNVKEIWIYMIVSGLAPLNLHPDICSKELWRTTLIVLVMHTS